MKTISIVLAGLFLTGLPAAAQESATQQQIDRLSGQIQDLQEAQALQNKRLDALEKDISDLRDKVNTPVVNDYPAGMTSKSWRISCRKLTGSARRTAT